MERQSDTGRHRSAAWSAAGTALIVGIVNIPDLFREAGIGQYLLVLLAAYVLAFGFWEAVFAVSRRR